MISVIIAGGGAVNEAQPAAAVDPRLHPHQIGQFGRHLSQLNPIVVYFLVCVFQVTRFPNRPPFSEPQPVGRFFCTQINHQSRQICTEGASIKDTQGWRLKWRRPLVRRGGKRDRLSPFPKSVFQSGRRTHHSSDT